MAAGITDLLSRVTDSTTGRPVIAQLANPGKAIGASSININDATNWTTVTAIHFSIFNTITVAGVTIKDVSTQTDWKGVLAGTTITGLVQTGGVDRDYTAGALVEITPTARYAKDLYDWGISHANQDGSLKTSAVQAALNIGTLPADWTPLATMPSTVVPLGNRSYQITIPGVDYTNVLHPSSRLRATRGTASPTQSTSLNGTNQYYSKTAPAGMTFTDDFVVGVWVKMSAYQNSIIASRSNSTNGWFLNIDATGKIIFNATNGGSGNYSQVSSYQTIGLNKWVYIVAQLDMSAFTATTTTSYIMIDGLDVPASVSRGGTNPTALVQAGNLEVGSYNGGTTLFAGKIVQLSIFNAKVLQATMLGYMSQGLIGTETSLISAYSFNNSITDLNTTNANNLTASGAAVATNADSPFGGQSSGVINSNIDYAIVSKATFSTNTVLIVQVPEGCTLPTVGTITALSYSDMKAPYGMPVQQGKWAIDAKYKNNTVVSTTSWKVFAGSIGIVLPVGCYVGGYSGSLYYDRGATADQGLYLTLSESTTVESNEDFTRFDNTSTSLGSNIFKNAPVNATDIPVTIATQTQLYFLQKSPIGAGNSGFNNGLPMIIRFYNAYL